MPRSPQFSTPNHRMPQPLLTELFHAAVSAVEPEAALRRAFRETPVPLTGRVWIIASGKASARMARAAVGILAADAVAPAGGVLISPERVASPHPAIRVCQAEHPVPGPGSLAAALAVDALISQIRSGDEAWVLLSGGTTSLLAAPAAGTGIDQEDLTTLFRSLLRSGLDIHAMNLVRKRVVRWGAGRLAAALGRAGARTRAFVISDVIDDDLAAIGSGPCVPDPTTAEEVRALLSHAHVWAAVPRGLRRYLDAVMQGAEPETPKPADQTFDRVASRVIATNDDAVNAAMVRARESGYRVARVAEPLRGEAALAGSRFVDGLDRAFPQDEGSPMPRCVVQGGETTVTLAGAPGNGWGGRCQEFALAAARRLFEADRAHRDWWILAAGTDGQDGPTDAAGAMIRGDTWQSIRNAGRDPSRDLERHQSYHALDAVGALFRPGATGTNVMDIVIAVEARKPSPASGRIPTGGVP